MDAHLLGAAAQILFCEKNKPHSASRRLFDDVAGITNRESVVIPKVEKAGSLVMQRCHGSERGRSFLPRLKKGSMQ
jgi:hypothetical protein